MTCAQPDYPNSIRIGVSVGYPSGCRPVNVGAYQAAEHCLKFAALSNGVRQRFSSAVLLCPAATNVCHLPYALQHSPLRLSAVLPSISFVSFRHWKAQPPSLGSNPYVATSAMPPRSISRHLPGVHTLVGFCCAPAIWSIAPVHRCGVYSAASVSSIDGAAKMSPTLVLISRALFAAFAIASATAAIGELNNSPSASFILSIEACALKLSRHRIALANVPLGKPGWTRLPHLAIACLRCASVNFDRRCCRASARTSRLHPPCQP